jgi:hypothetical protein
MRHGGAGGRRAEQQKASDDRYAQALSESSMPKRVSGRSSAMEQIATGTPIGAYDILGLLGAAMGVVYRARDTTPAARSRSRSCRASSRRTVSGWRPEREARMLAALNHPHIGAIFGPEEAEGHRAPVLELVEGDPADRAAGPGAGR